MSDPGALEVSGHAPGSNADPFEEDPAFVDLTPGQQRLARVGERLFKALAAGAGQKLQHPLRARPFEGGVAVVRAIRGGGSILVAEDGTVLYRASSYSFDRALTEFRAGQRTPLESFR